MTVLEEMTLLMLAIPRGAASVTDVAAWYERKATLLEHIAAEGGPDALDVHAQAISARDHANRLRSA